MRAKSLIDCAWLLCIALSSAQAFAQATAQKQLQVQAQASQADVVALPWTERKPFQFVDRDGKPSGLLYELGRDIFTAAGVPMKWVEVPAARIGRSLLTDDARLCLVGWFRTPEREKIAKISLPIYRDHPQVGVARADSRIGEKRSLLSITEDRSIRILVKQGYSYGTYLDSLLALRKGQAIESVVADHARMLVMLQRGRADLIFLTQEEVDYFSSENPHFNNEFRAIPFKELPVGNQRHILCTKQVPDEIMDRLNAAITTIIRNKAD